MSLTSYRAAPPRAGGVDWTAVRGNAGALGLPRRRFGGWIGRPGGDLLSRALRHSTMGAGEFHGRVRDGIGCRLPAMATRSSNPPPGRLPGKTVVRQAAAATGKRGRADPKGSHPGDRRPPVRGRPSAAAEGGGSGAALCAGGAPPADNGCLSENDFPEDDSPGDDFHAWWQVTRLAGQVWPRTAAPNRGYRAARAIRTS
jgi:hypothetical protein